MIKYKINVGMILALYINELVQKLKNKQGGTPMSMKIDDINTTADKNSGTSIIVDLKDDNNVQSLLIVINNQQSEIGNFWVLNGKFYQDDDVPLSDDVKMALDKIIDYHFNFQNEINDITDEVVEMNTIQKMIDEKNLPFAAFCKGSEILGRFF